MKKLLYLILMINILFAQDFNSLEISRERSIVIEKTLNFLLLDFKELKKEILLLKSQNKILSQKVSSLENISSQEINNIVQQTTVDMPEYIVLEDYTPTYSQTNITSKIINLYLKDDILKATVEDDIWMKTSKNSYIKINSIKKVNTK